MSTIKTISFHIAGLAHHEFDPTLDPEGSEVQLVLEPENPYAHNAILVIAADDITKFGYVPRNETSIFHEALARGATLDAVISSIDLDEPVSRRVKIDVKITEPSNK